MLNGQNLSFVSTFGDEIKSDKRYDKYYSWHFVNFPFDQSYEESEKNPEGDIIRGIAHCIQVLKDPGASKEDKVFFLKFLVHLVGDLHQPMHIGKAEDRGGNDIKVKWHGRSSNLHRVWDSDMIESWDMSYTELADNADKLSKEQIRAIESGTVLDWANETRILTQKVYASANQDDNLGYKYSYEYFETARRQMQRSGIRLARILNDLYR